MRFVFLVVKFFADKLFKKLMQQYLHKMKKKISFEVTAEIIDNKSCERFWF